MSGYTIDTTKYINKMKSFCRAQGVNIDLDNPKTIQDKLAWLNIYDVNPLKCKCADKIQLHDYCKEILGEDICVPIIKIYNSVEEINFDELPDKFVIKCNHGSGMNIIVKDKSTMNINDVKRKLSMWMKDDFAMRNGFEAHYHDIPHKIFVEEYMNDGHETLYDYKFWCFNGKPYMYTINDGNGHGNWMKFYNMKREALPYKRPDFSGEPENEISHPKRFNKMKEFSKKLSESFKFARVDFYEVDGKIYLGEMTFTPGAIAFKYKNPEDNVNAGKFLML